MTLIGPFLGLIGLFLFFAIDSENGGFFRDPSNLRIIIIQTVIVALGALGMTMIIVSGGIDLSVGSVISLSGVTAAVILNTAVASGIGASTSAWLAVGAGLGVGCLVGGINGSLITTLRIPAFIVTLGMLGIARGTSKWLAGNQAVAVEKSWIGSLLSQSQLYFHFPIGVWITIVLAVLTSVLMKYTIFGRYMYAVGSNESTARLCGINVGLNRIMIYSLAGTLFGLTGIMQLARLRTGDPTVAVGLELDIIAAVIIGGASLSGGKGGILGSIIGALIMSVLRVGSTQRDWPNYIQEIIIGIVIILAVTVDHFRSRKDKS